MSPRRLAAIAIAGSAIVLISTTPAIPIVWDEGEYLHRSGDILSWFRLLLNFTRPDGGLHALSSSAIQEHWTFISIYEGHPAWGVIPMAISTWLAGSFVHPLTAARLGTIVVFSVACGVVAYRLRQLFGAVAAIVAVTAFLTFPRLFSEAHFATLDAPLTAWWLMLWAVDASARSNVGTTIAVGVLAGLTSATKFTGWFAWGPLVLSRILRWNLRAFLSLLLIVPIGVVTFCVVNPPTWHHPISAVHQHFVLSLNRATAVANLPVMFFGEVYDLTKPLPWYNTMVWLLIVTPLPLLILGAIGLFHSVRLRYGTVGVSIVLHWATLMVVRAMPQAPPHDGIRLFLPAFGFWCVLAGVGAQHVWDRSRQWSPRRALLTRAAMMVALLADAVTVARYYPQTLSHYNLLVGGVRGAASLGFEPTYWWDALDDDVLTWLNTHTGPDERVGFSATENISLLRSWARLRVPQASRYAVFKWYVLQNRSGFLGSGDRRLLATVKPAYVKYPGHHPEGGTVAPDLKVPLIAVYTFEEFRAAYR